MQNGTKTEQMLDILANGGDTSSMRGCCNTKTQDLILDAADRVQAVEDEVEELKNNPDVADIVATYADLEAYDTSKLTDKDVIRVLSDENHDGDSTYYRYSTSTETFTYIGESKQYTNFVGTDGQTAGQNGLVPAPATTDANKFLKSDGTWDTAGSSITPVQTTGTSQTDVMSQNAVTSMIFADPANATEISIGNSSAGENAVSIGIAAYGTGQYSVALGDHSNTYGGQNAIAIGHSARARNTNTIAIGTNSNSGQDGGANSVAIGNNSHAGEESVTIGENAGDYTQNNTVSIGRGAQAWGRGSVAIGDQTIMNSTNSVRGTVSIKASATGYGYNGASNYRLLTGLYDGQNSNDAVNVGQINSVIDAINTALSVNIPHIGANTQP